MYIISTRFNGQGKDVVGKEFKRKRDAVGFLHDHGWRRNERDGSEYEKEGRPRPCGMLSFSVTEYVYIEKV